MGSKLIKTKNTESINRCIKKFNTVPVSSSVIEGHFIIDRYRQYTYYPEVDVTFVGKLRCRLDFKSDWYTKKQLYNTTKNVSKIKINRMIRKQIIKDLSTHLRYFSIELNHYSQIKKINWK